MISHSSNVNGGIPSKLGWSEFNSRMGVGYYVSVAYSYSQQPDPEDRMTAGGGGAVGSGSDCREESDKIIGVDKLSRLSLVGYYVSVAHESADNSRYQNDEVRS